MQWSAICKRKNRGQAMDTAQGHAALQVAVDYTEPSRTLKEVLHIWVSCAISSSFPYKAQGCSVLALQ